MFYVRKTLPSGPVRFGVAQRRTEPLTDSRLSTGPRGEYLRRGAQGLFYSEVPHEEMKDATGQADERHHGFNFAPLAIARMVVGLTLIIFGLLVVIGRNDAIGYIELVIGASLIVVPPIRNWKRERQHREAMRLDREARAAEEARRREMVGSFAERLHSLRERHDAPALAAVRAERESKDIPYEAIATLARRMVVDTGFEAVATTHDRGAEAVGREIDDVARAVGLSPDDLLAAKQEIYQRLLWHLLADDRLGDQQAATMLSMERSFGLTEAQTAMDHATTRELRSLAILTANSLPSRTCTPNLRFQEVCHHESAGTLLRPASRLQRSKKWETISPCTISITSKRIIITAKSTTSIPLGRVFDLEVDKDQDVLIIGSEGKKRHFLRLTDPIITAGVIEAAAARPIKPQGLV